MDRVFVESATQATMVCPHCGSYGLMVQKVTPDGLTVANLRGDGKELRHRMMQAVELSLRLVCANAKCNAIIEG